MTPATDPGSTLARVANLAAAQGLALRGGFRPVEADGVPPFADGTPVATVVLVGNVGAAMWPRFAASPEFHDDGAPLDRWTRRVVDGIAAEAGARALYPFDGPPFLPFQRWAMHAEPVHVSPLRLLIHPEHGLWHAYRAALVFAAPIDLPPVREAASPCARCTARPCLSACPVGAFADDGFDAAACSRHLHARAGHACLDQGCRARDACPVGAAHRYDVAQVRFHMRAYARRPRH